jgi:hypothetical protein
MDERCPPVIISGMHHSSTGRFSNDRCDYITTILKFSGKKESLRIDVFIDSFVKPLVLLLKEPKPMILQKKFQKTGINTGTNHH